MKNHVAIVVMAITTFSCTTPEDVIEKYRVEGEKMTELVTKTYELVNTLTPPEEEFISKDLDFDFRKQVIKFEHNLELNSFVLSMEDLDIEVHNNWERKRFNVGHVSWFEDAIALISTGRYALSEQTPQEGFVPENVEYLEKLLQTYTSIKYLLVIKPKEIIKPKVTSTGDYTNEFSPGQFLGEAYLIEIGEQKVVGYFNIEAENNDKVDIGEMSFWDVIELDLEQNTRYEIRSKIGAYSKSKKLPYNTSAYDLYL